MENSHMNHNNPSRSARYQLPSQQMTRLIAQLPAEPLELGECKSLAIAYVLWQRWQEVYSCERALEHGTLFPELNKPFLGGKCS